MNAMAYEDMELARARDAAENERWGCYARLYISDDDPERMKAERTMSRYDFNAWCYERFTQDRAHHDRKAREFFGWVIAAIVAAGLLWIVNG
jgi:hypothetical protein